MKISINKCGLISITYATPAEINNSRRLKALVECLQALRNTGEETIDIKYSDDGSISLEVEEEGDDDELY